MALEMIVVLRLVLVKGLGKAKQLAFAFIFYPPLLVWYP